MEPNQSVLRDEFAQLTAQMAQMMQLMQAHQGTTAVITPAVPPPLPTIPTKTSLELLVDETNASTPTGLGQWEAPDVVWSVFEKLCKKGPLPSPNTTKRASMSTYSRTREARLSTKCQPYFQW